MLKLLIRFGLGTLTFAGAVALADDDAPSRVPPTPIVDASEIAGLGISLIVVIAAILIVGWMYSRLRVGGGSGGDIINVVATRPLGPKERLMVIEIADQQLLVGMTASQLQTLHIFDEPVATRPTLADQSGFAGRLRSAIREVTK